MARIIAEVVGVRTDGRDVRIDLRIETLQSTVTLVAASAGPAEMLAGPSNRPIKLGEPKSRSVTLRFRDGVPEFFTLMLDFGKAGFGTVLVIAR